MNPAEAAPIPEYSCAILTDRDGRLLLQKRGPEARRAANQVTCLGGRVEPDESPEACLRRELAEEIGHVPKQLELRIVLIVEGRLVAYFYRGVLAIPLDSLTLESGIEVVLVSRPGLDILPIHLWHRLAIEAEVRGDTWVVIRP